MSMASLQLLVPARHAVRRLSRPNRTDIPGPREITNKFVIGNKMDPHRQNAQRVEHHVDAVAAIPTEK